MEGSLVHEECERLPISFLAQLIDEVGKDLGVDWMVVGSKMIKSIIPRNTCKCSYITNVDVALVDFNRFSFDPVVLLCVRATGEHRFVDVNDGQLLLECHLHLLSALLNFLRHKENLLYWRKLDHSDFLEDDAMLLVGRPQLCGIDPSASKSFRE
jgi:hypothetical protein